MSLVVEVVDGHQANAAASFSITMWTKRRLALLSVEDVENIEIMGGRLEIAELGRIAARRHRGEHWRPSSRPG
jgi:hypothetical protein